ncbi:response regulator [Verrucomicrobiota bacterium]
MEKKVLFIDDEKDILEMMIRLFDSEGFSPHYSTNPEKALGIIKRENIRVCFLDLRMPKMDGIELCRRIKQFDPNIQVYALSAFIEAYSPDQISEAGFEGALGKPFNLDEVLGAANRAFEKLQ